MMVHAPLPVHPIDLAPFRLGGAAERASVADAIDRAYCDSGFLLITGHGVPLDLCDAVLDAFGGFFDLPLDEKRRVVVPDASANRGYSELGKEALAYSRGAETPPDMFEAFNVGREDVLGPYFDAYRTFFAPNVWPARPTGLRATWLEYEHAVEGVADALLRAMALALHLDDETWFVERCRRAIVTTRTINYPGAAPRAGLAPGLMRMGAHTDYGIITILLADDVPGLQVFRAGAWHDVAVPRGSFVCNVGDMLARWTNDRWTSTLHRVVPPPATAESAVRRRAIARFLDCEPDRVVACIETCIGRDRPAKYAPIVAGEWLKAKILRGREMRLPGLPAES